MDRVTARTVAAPGHAIPADLIESLHDPLLLDTINDRWQKAGCGVTVEVLLDTQQSDEAEQQAWREVGTRLSERLLALGKWYGLCLHTADLRFDTVLTWVRTATDNGAQARADLTLISRPHIAGFTWNTEVVQCCLLQSCCFGGWLKAVWADTSPGHFFYPDFVLAVYEDDVTEAVERDDPLTEAVFAATLGRAIGWLVPYGDPPLFVMGLPSASALFLELRGSAQDMRCRRD